MPFQNALLTEGPQKIPKKITFATRTTEIILRSR